jgi:hypothetical protein
MRNEDTLEKFNEVYTDNTEFLKATMRAEILIAKRRQKDLLREGLGALAVLADPDFQGEDFADILQDAENLRQKLLGHFAADRQREEAVLSDRFARNIPA